MERFGVTTNSPEETQRLARRLGEACTGGEVFLLVGPLGAGKTAFTQGLAWGLGVEEYTHSPTFVLVTEYHGTARQGRPALTLYHMDLYRIESVPEAVDVGLREYVDAGGVTAIEWADKADEALAGAGLRVEISYTGDNRREITFRPQDDHHAALLAGARAQWEAEQAIPSR
jgi:tRNA threonylcarbamoyladenosine biosynthesis protein TsaE